MGWCEAALELGGNRSWSAAEADIANGRQCGATSSWARVMTLGVVGRSVDRIPGVGGPVVVSEPGR